MRHRQVDKCLAGAGQVFVVFGQPSVPAQPGECPLHYPSLGLHFEPFGSWFSVDYVHRPCVDVADPFQPQPSVRLVSVDHQQTRHRKCSPPKQRLGTFLIRDTSRMHDHHQQQSQCVHQNVAFSPFDLLASVIPNRTCYLVAPPFSAPFTDWLSTIATLGSGSWHSSMRILRRRRSLMRSNTPSSRHLAKYPYTASQGGKS
jgi:hypothetical protein